MKIIVDKSKKEFVFLLTYKQLLFYFILILIFITSILVYKSLNTIILWYN